VSVYPITEAFKRDVSRLRSRAAQVAGISFGRMLKEYEHGTADIGDLAPGMTVKAAAAVLMEALLHLDGEEAP
jgi:hypothetical protein